ncbi:MAG: DEAD/DEAH box helicase [Clostridiaceae bacterium]|jgi:SNF2 family DNA or RNA helicase|nr:DEAD/DEAH box helicase [Clostridiaceae bacterium]
MNYLKLTDKEIRDYVNDINIYHRGRMYFFNKFVEDIHFDTSGKRITAKVKGSRYYNVELFINSYQNIVSESCSCPYFREWGKPCKHVAATLFETRLMVENKFSKYRNSHKAVNAIFKKLDNMSISGVSRNKKEQLYLTPTLTINHDGKNLHAYLELKVGSARAYVVKSTEEFIEAWVKGKRLVFGRQLTLDSSLQYFDGKDALIMDMLTEIYSTQIGISNYDFRYNGLLRGRYFSLVPAKLEKFLDIMTGEAVPAFILSDDLKIVPVTKAVMPLTFEMRQYEEWISLRIASEELPLRLTPDGKYFFYRGIIYKLPPEQQKYFSVIHEGFVEAESNEVIVPNQYQGRFISEVVPIMKKTGDVMVSPSIKRKIVHEQLKAAVYLDLYKNGISARVLFNYGDIQLNPALGSGTTDNKDRFVLRDIETEKPILDLLRSSRFFIEKDLFCLVNKEDIYNFVFERLPELLSLSEVYYSEDFKKVTVKRSVSIKGRVSFVDDLLEISFDTQDFDPDELKGILESLRRKKKFYRLKDGAILPLDEYPDIKEFACLTDKMDIGVGDFDGKVVRLPKYRALYLDSLCDNALQNVENTNQKSFSLLERSENFRHFVNNITFIKDKEFEVPKSLKNVLRDYQKTGFQWFKGLSQNGLGGILADDMGLGKTLQVLAFLLSEKENACSPSLVVAPTSLVYNWVLEAEKFTPELKVLAISGNRALRQSLLEKMDEYDLVVTSYPLIRRDIGFYKNKRFSCCFIDEAQHVKNHFTQSARAIRKIQAKSRFALTGTPMENSLLELWSIFDFLMPSYLFTQQKFQDRFVKPTLNGESKKAIMDLNRHIRPFILRRMKKDVLRELPEKIETTLTCKMTEAQRNIYLALLSQVRREIDLAIMQQGFEKSHIQILAALTRLRQVCCHPSTFVDGYVGGSGKLELLEELTDSTLEAGHRVLIFSQFTSMLDIIERMIAKKGIQYFYLSGKTPSSQRAEFVSRFNSGEGRVFLLSLKAGGTGLTLTGADTVIIYDPWWNPAVEEQAIDRAYRIGQEKVVQVFKLITRNTIEEKIIKLQEKKKEMIYMVIKPGETMLHKLSEEEIRSLFE